MDVNVCVGIGVAVLLFVGTGVGEAGMGLTVGTGVLVGRAVETDVGLAQPIRSKPNVITKIVLE